MPSSPSSAAPMPSAQSIRRNETRSISRTTWWTTKNADHMRTSLSTTRESAPTASPGSNARTNVMAGASPSRGNTTTSGRVIARHAHPAAIARNAISVGETAPSADSGTWYASSGARTQPSTSAQPGETHARTKYPAPTASASGISGVVA
jgi:hypothetical protein